MSEITFTRPRRLPVFFVLDTSAAMDGTFAVTMQDGLLIVKRELAQHAAAARQVCLSVITFGDVVTETALQPTERFTPPEWLAGGSCQLRPALTSLAGALNYDLILPRPEHPGDYAPLVFLVLGDDPSDGWAEARQALMSFTSLAVNQRPFLVSLVVYPRLAEKMHDINTHLLLLQSAQAVAMTAFFFWTARVIVKMFENNERGSGEMIFPDVPRSIVIAR